MVVFHKPTYGLDLKTTRVVRGMIEELRDGRAALVISTDLDELLEVSDRIVVLSRGRIVGEVENGPGAAEQIGRLMIGDVSLGVSRRRGGGRMSEISLHAAEVASVADAQPDPAPGAPGALAPPARRARRADPLARPGACSR